MLSKTDIIESLLFASDKPVQLKKLAQIVELTLPETQAELDALREEKNSIGSIQLIEVAGGWQLATKPQFSNYIRQLRDAPRQRLSRAAFEVLAVVAYRQPVTRAEIESLRGVDCSGPVQFLLEKKLLAFAGRKDAPGRPHLYGTTPEFLDHFGLRDLKDLPTLEELAELNGGALVHSEIHDGDSLFNRGAMRTEAEFDEDQEAAADESGQADTAVANAEASGEPAELEAPAEGEESTAIEEPDAVEEFEPVDADAATISDMQDELANAEMEPAAEALDTQTEPAEPEAEASAAEPAEAEGSGDDVANSPAPEVEEAVQQEESAVTA